MPTYIYNCSNIDCEVSTFESTASIKEPLLEICPFCQEKSVNILPQPFTVIDATPKTLGSLSDKNYGKIGQYKKDALTKKYKEDAMRASQFLGKVPEGAKSVERQAYIPPWRDTEKVDKSLSKLLQPGQEKKLERFIITGKK